MSEQYRLRVVPDPLPPRPSQWAGFIGCWLALIVFCVGAWVVLGVAISWVWRR